MTLIWVEGTFFSKQTPIHGPVYKSDQKFAYSRRHSVCFPKEVSKRLIKYLTQTASCASMIIDTVISGFSPN